MKRRGAIRTGLLLGLAAFLLLVSIVIDVGLSRPAMREVEHLQMQRADLLARGTRALEQSQLNEDLAKRFGLEELAQILKEGPQRDPLSYVGQLIDASGLTRLDLTSGEVNVAQGIRRSRFTLRLVGSYDSLLSFVRSLEEGRRLASVDDFDIESMPETSRLEGKLKISIYDPVVEQE